MTVLPDLRRGDSRTITISGLTDADGNPAVFGAGDLIQFTMKRYAGQPNVDALIAKTSEDDGITFDAGDDTAVVHLTPTDWENVTPRALDIPYVWDVQLAAGGDFDDVVTLASGTGMILSDITHIDPVVAIITTTITTYELPDPPLADIATTTDTGPAPFTFDADASASVGTDLAYRWDWTNDGVDDTGEPVTTHEYTDAGVYEVRLRVTDRFGQYDEATALITVT